MHEAHIERLDTGALTKYIAILGQELSQALKVSMDRSMERRGKHDRALGEGRGRRELRAKSSSSGGAEGKEERAHRTKKVARHRGHE